MHPDLHVTLAEQQAAHEFFRHLRVIASQAGFVVRDDGAYATIAKLVKTKIGSRKPDDTTLVAAMRDIEQEHPHLFANETAQP